MAFLGQAKSFGAVASWLESLATLQDYVYPFFTNAADSSVDSLNTSVDFDSSAELTDEALSGRYGPPGTSNNSGAQPSPNPSAPASAPPATGESATATPSPSGEAQ
jgi:hypothetical protein